QPPIYGAAINPRMISRVAECCDGLALLSTGIGEPYLEQVVIPAVREGRLKAGKSQAGEIACWCITIVHEDQAIARHLARRQLAFYFSTPSYRGPGEYLGFAADVAKLQAAFRQSASQD